MPADRPQPELSTVDNYNRRFGRYDFKRFDHLVSQHASLGDASLGKSMSTGCDSAGIIYLDLAFSQPSDCRLKSATVQVTLDDDDEHLVRQFRTPSSRPPVQIVKYGPRHMTGEPKYERVTTHNKFVPSVEIGPFGGAGGVGRESAKETVRECRWTFESHLMTGSRKRRTNNWAYKVLQWQITENELNTQSMHSNTVHTAFSFVHGGQPFFMRVEVGGRLERWRSDLGHQIRHKMSKLRFPASSQNARYATTLINFNGRDQFTTPLDGLVQGLELAMEHENMTSPVELKGSQQPRFFQADSEESGSATPSGKQPDSQHLLEEQRDPTAPTIENIASLSSRWLMAPPITPLPPHNNTHMVEEVLERQSSNATRPQTGSEDEAGGTNTATFQSRELQSRASEVDLGTVMFIFRVWMLQTLATLLGYGTNKSVESPAS
ncbi:hypothetical protein F4808DRAFT_454201 [Astrocystis sublimbata]|nr:hypothetical protein F4808DRAFT_454201 [Astrocystis sublimbata]